MNTLTEAELDTVSGGIQQGSLTLLGEQLAADGLAYMDSGNTIKSGAGLFVAAAGGWAWAIGSAWDGLRTWWG